MACYLGGRQQALVGGVVAHSLQLGGKSLMSQGQVHTEQPFYVYPAVVSGGQLVVVFAVSAG